MPIINPLEIDHESTPVAVLLDNMQGFIPWAIKDHSNGNYSHIMWLLDGGLCASQDPQGYRLRQITDFMSFKFRMKFFKIKNFAARLNLYDKINYDLKEKTGKRYDFLGIIGQALNIPWIQNPYKKFCSERFAEDLKVCYGCKDIKKQPSPSDCNTFMINRPNKFELIGHWFID